jgi:hypothetical protein
MKTRVAFNTSTEAPGSMPVMDTQLENKNAVVYGGAGSVTLPLPTSAPASGRE